MGEPATIYVLDKEGGPLVLLRKHWDGDPGRLGQALYAFLIERKIVNGYPPAANWIHYSNGWDNLAAQLVCYLVSQNPNRVGDIYFDNFPPMDGFDWIQKPDLITSSIDDMGEYMYVIFPTQPDIFALYPNRDINPISMAIFSQDYSTSYIGCIDEFPDLLDTYDGWNYHKGRNWYFSKTYNLPDY